MRCSLNEIIKKENIAPNCWERDAIKVNANQKKDNNRPICTLPTLYNCVVNLYNTRGCVESVTDS